VLKLTKSVPPRPLVAKSAHCLTARFFDQSTATKTFQRGMDANNHPNFYTQLGKEPQELVTAALKVLAKRFDLR
jgi:hypothetical protein